MFHSHLISGHGFSPQVQCQLRLWCDLRTAGGQASENWLVWRCPAQSPKHGNIWQLPLKGRWHLILVRADPLAQAESRRVRSVRFRPTGTMAPDIVWHTQCIIEHVPLSSCVYTNILYYLYIPTHTHIERERGAPYLIVYIYIYR